MAKKVRFRRTVKTPTQELADLLSEPRKDEDAVHRRMLAWYKSERRYGRTYPHDDSYIAWLEEKVGCRVEDAGDVWLTTCEAKAAAVED